MRDIVLVWTNCGSAEEAEAIGRALVAQRLAACANSWRIHSIYRWDGKVVAQDEHRLLVKTLPVKVEAVRQAIAERHGYELPAIIAETVAASNDYARWVAEMVDFSGEGDGI